MVSAEVPVFFLRFSLGRGEEKMKEKDTTIGQVPIRDARTLGAPRMLVLGLQHMFAMFGATVLVPILVQSYGLPLSTQTTLFFAGFGTLFFHLCTKLEIPAFLGSSFAFLGGFSAMANLDTGKYAAMAPGEKLQYACGGIVVAGLLYVILALVVKVVGVHRVMRFLPPVVTGPIIILIGLNLAPSAVSNASTCWWLALVSMAIIVAANIWGRGMVKIIPILLGVVGGYVAALYAMVLSFSPAFAYLVNTIPAAIIGGVSFILYGMISAIGVRNVVENRVDFTNSRNLIIAAVILVCGLGFTDGLTFHVGGVTITLTSLAVAAIAGIVLNAILPGNDFHFGKSESGDDVASLGRY